MIKWCIGVMVVLKQSFAKDGVAVYVVRKDYDDKALAEKKLGKKLRAQDCKVVIGNNADVYTEEGKLLLRFRKNVLSQTNVERAYNNLIGFAKGRTTTRGATSATAPGQRLAGINIPIMSNIIGFFDKWTIKHRGIFKTLGIPPPFQVRVTRFTTLHPDKWEAVIPLIQDIDRMYKTLAPTQHAKQMREANATAYRVPGTCFTTVTTNVNLQTACHTDTGDFKEGFGNLVVIENGRYKGGYTTFPQYGVGVDVRTGDFLAMDVHEVHGNTPIVPIDQEATRLSLVSYLREDVVNKSRGSTAAHVRKNIATMKQLLEKARTKKNSGRNI